MGALVFLRRGMMVVVVVSLVALRGHWLDGGWIAALHIGDVGSCRGGTPCAARMLHIGNEMSVA